MKHASLFSGIGGPEVAAALLGWENVFHCEINPFGRKVLDYWFPNSISYEDITKTSFKEWRGKIDILTGGFPCQPFSYAGKRGGREDERYLWPEMLRAIDEIRPTWVVGENVAGLATMVEGGVLTDMGGSPSLFDEGDDIHGYLLRQSFTIERICTDLERLGYSVQPVLIPAAAVGAPHRRDRIFIIAHDADAHRGDDERGAGSDERESVCEGVQERDEVRLVGVADQLRPEIQESAANPASDGLHGCTREDGQERCIDSDGKRAAAEGSNGVGLRREFGIYGQQFNAPDTNCAGREKPLQPGRVEDQQETGTRENDRAERPRRYGSSSDTEDAWNPYGSWNVLQEEREVQAQCDAEPRRVCRRFCQSLLPENRWSEFPTVSPVHRGNDGLPFNVDDLTISFTRWRTESLKAYGNAIVPQVMYRIFEAIQACEA